MLLLMAEGGYESFGIQIASSLIYYRIIHNSYMGWFIVLILALSLLTAIYGLHTIAHQCALWDALRDLGSQINSPWLIMGDFNAILDIDDRVNGTAM